MNWKFLALIAFFFLAYNGCDGLTGNKDLVEYSIEKIEQSGTAENRYIQINNGYTTGEFVYHTDKNLPNSANSIIFPLISKSNFEKGVKGETNLSIKVLVQRSSKRFNSHCIEDTSCINDVVDQQMKKKGYSVKGLTLIGLNDVDSETKKLLGSSGFNIDSNVVFLEEDMEPTSNTKSILMLIGGILGIIGILNTFISPKTE
jgi:hypothetical protein